MKNFRKIAFIFLAMCFALFAFVASCHKSDVDKSNTTKSKQDVFFEFATVSVQGKGEDFRGEHTLLGSLFKLDEARYCRLFSFLLCKPFADWDTIKEELLFQGKHVAQKHIDLSDEPYELEIFGKGVFNTALQNTFTNTFVVGDKDLLELFRKFI